jgi:hypothetical protein
VTSLPHHRVDGLRTGGSTGLSLGRYVEAGETELRNSVAQGPLDRPASGHAPEARAPTGGDRCIGFDGDATAQFVEAALVFCRYRQRYERGLQRIHASRFVTHELHALLHAGSRTNPLAPGLQMCDALSKVSRIASDCRARRKRRRCSANSWSSVPRMFARLDAEREKLSGQLEELEITERVLARFGGKAVTTEKRRRARPARTTPAAAGERRNRSSQKALGVSISDASLKAVQAYSEGATPAELLNYLSREFGMTVRPNHRLKRQLSFPVSMISQ